MPRAASRTIALFALAACCALSVCHAAEGVAHYDVTVSIVPADRTVSVDGTMMVARGQELQLRLDDRFQVQRFEALDAPPEAMEKAADGSRWRVRAPPARTVTIAFRYAGQAQRLDRASAQRTLTQVAEPLVGPDGIYLPSGAAWYPEPDRGRVTYRVRVRLPSAAGISYRAVVPGRLEHEHVRPQGSEAVFASFDALPGIDLFGGPYEVAERSLELPGGPTIHVRTYFHAELSSLAATYLDAAAEHLLRYHRSIGPYAFESYSIVSSPLPVGFGMPGVAYLGKAVVRLPFIPATSLRHEVLHNWWGNGVEPRYAEGNWAEGLTTLLADYALREERGPDEAKATRLGWLRDFAAVPVQQDRPLASFVARLHGADQAVGYNKTAFVLFLLRERIGTQAFEEALRSFWREHRLRSAGWRDLQRAFENASGTSLDTFFSQWLHRPGAPLLEIASARHAKAAHRHAVDIVLTQAGTPFALRVPLRVHHARGHTDASIPIEGGRASAVVDLPAPAQFVEIDPEVRIFRRLHPEELAPTLRRVLLDPRTRVVVAASEELARAAALRAAQAALEGEVQLLDAGAAESAGPLLIVGLYREVGAQLARLQLPQRDLPGGSAATAAAYAWRTGQGRHYAVVAAADAASLEAIARPLPHLGAQSYVLFDGGRSTARGLWPAQPRRYRVTD